MSYENYPKNLPETVALTRTGTPEYSKLAADPFPVPTADPKEQGAILEVTDTGDRYTWTGTVWVQKVVGGADRVTDVPLTYFGLELVAGRIPNKSFVRVFGRNPDIDSATGFNAIWHNGGSYTGFDAVVAEPLSIVSTDANDTLAGTGARSLRVQGLDASFNPISEDINLNGTTPVVTVNSYYRWAITFVLSAGSNGFNIGTITGNQNVTTANVFFAMGPETNRSIAAVHTVPAGKLYYASKVFAAVSGKNTVHCETQVLARLPGLPFQVFEWFSVEAAGNSYVSRDLDYPFLPIPAGTDVYMRAEADTNNSAMSAGVEFIIEDA